jgi:catechol 2,3-dioxygenase-like lactoylglutathione lyase family enzyme
MPVFCRDLEQAKAFFTQVIGGELIHALDGFAEVRVAGIILGLTNRHGRATGRDAEYPHYAFFIEAEDFLPMVAWLHQNGVRTSEPWSRDGIKGLLYFRNPTLRYGLAVRAHTQQPFGTGIEILGAHVDYHHPEQMKGDHQRHADLQSLRGDGHLGQAAGRGGDNHRGDR